MEFAGPNQFEDTTISQIFEKRSGWMSYKRRKLNSTTAELATKYF